MEILLSITQTDITSGFKFKNTGITIYSFEEALYYYFNYWKDSQNDFLTADFINWVSIELKQKDLAKSLKKLKSVKKFSDRYIKFLETIDYFSQNELSGLKENLELWEARLTWERYKEDGDFFASKGEFFKAINLYEKAKNHVSSFEIYNNIGVVYSKLGNNKLAIDYFEKAYFINNEKGKFNEDIVFNLAETLLFDNQVEKAKDLIALLSESESKFYLLGLYNDVTNNIILSASFYNRAYNISQDDFYLHKIVDLYIKLEKYDVAMQYLDRIVNKNNLYYYKIVQIYELTDKVDQAIMLILEKITSTKDDVFLLIELSKCYRLKGEFDSAEKVITIAESYEPKNDKILLEKAIIKKELGFVKDFQVILNDILLSFKKQYRDASEV